MDDRSRKQQYDEIRYDRLKSDPAFQQRKAESDKKYRLKASTALRFVKEYPQLWEEFCLKHGFDFSDGRASNKPPEKIKPKAWWKVWE